MSITIINGIYSFAALKFTIEENHKYDIYYEKSLIYKNAAFKFVNSYLAIVYTTYFK